MDFKVSKDYEDVACPGVFGELALHAIQTAKELTVQLREKNPQWADYLFLVPRHRPDNTALVLTPPQINDYLNGAAGLPGLRHRYSIQVAKITTHNFRHTRATNAWLGGLQVHEVAYDLGHFGTQMALQHYIVGDKESKQRLINLMDRGALSGALLDLVGGQELVQTRLCRRHVEIMRKQGRVLTPTRYGYCALPAVSGPCPRAIPCYSGPDGEPCDYHILSPDALPALEEDREVLEASIAANEMDPSFRTWIQHLGIQRDIVDRTIERVRKLELGQIDSNTMQLLNDEK